MECGNVGQEKLVSKGGAEARHKTDRRAVQGEELERGS